MTSRELVYKSLNMDAPPRMPRHLTVLPWTEEHFPQELAELQRRYPNDIVSCPEFLTVYPQTEGGKYSKGIYRDEWGCVFNNCQSGVIGEVKTPLIGDWSEFDKLKTPDELLSVDKEKVNAFCRNSDEFVVSPILARPFERIQFIRGTENIYLDLALNPDEIRHLLNILHEFYVKRLEAWAATDVDALFIMDDWGMQNSLLISLDMWKEFFKELYREYIDIAHRHGKFILMHSDGCIQEIIPELVEMGLDALNSQLFCMDIEDLGRNFRGKITFWGEVDRQYLLVNGTADEVKSAVCKIQNSLYDNGGVIAQCEFGLGARPENIAAALETWSNVL
jgi:hypothetical protein